MMFNGDSALKKWDVSRIAVWVRVVELNPANYFAWIGLAEVHQMSKPDLHRVHVSPSPTPPRSLPHFSYSLTPLLVDPRSLPHSLNHLISHFRTLHSQARLWASKDGMFTGSFGSISTSQEVCTSPKEAPATTPSPTQTVAAAFSPPSREDLEQAVALCLKLSPQDDYIWSAWTDRGVGRIHLYL